MITKLVSIVEWVIKAPLLMLIIGYQKLISPMLGSRCRYYPSCSSYAIESLNIFNPVKALWLIVYRVVRCNPLSAGGFDPVPRPADGRRVS